MTPATAELLAAARALVDLCRVQHFAPVSAKRLTMAVLAVEAGGGAIVKSAAKPGELA